MPLSPPHTAVLVVDMMNDFCAEGGAGNRFGWAAKRGSVGEAKRAAMRDC